MFVTSHNIKQLVKAVYMITFYDHIKNVQQILREYDRVNRPTQNYDKLQMTLKESSCKRQQEYDQAFATK